MKKKLLSLLLALCLVMALVPMTAFCRRNTIVWWWDRYTGRPVANYFARGFDCFGRVSNSGNAETFDTENAGVGNCHGYYFKQNC